MRVYELPPPLYSRAASLFDEGWADGAFIRSAFEGTVAARLFVDDAARPTAALFCRTFEYYVAGDPAATALRRFMRDAPAEVYGDFYGYVATNVPLSRAIMDDYAGRLITVARRGYRWEGDAVAVAALDRWRGPLPDGAVIRRFDRALAERADREWGTLTAGFWGDHERFLKRGFGFCTLVGGAFAGICYAAGVGGGEANIAVVTAPAFRRRGHAARACVAFIDHCRANGLVATWDTDSDNQPSANLARALGFREDHPFSQLSTPGYRPLDRSQGRWQPSVPDAEGIVTWRHVAGE
jgi:RimJ/RimL family protein N-acetyltransferase